MPHLRPLAVMLCTILALLGFGPLYPLAPVRASSICGAYGMTATSSNTSGDSMNTVETDPSEIIIVTANYDPNGIYDNHPIGVWWNGSHWAVFNEDQAAMPLGATFNIWYVGPNNEYNSVVQTATSGNITSNSTFINNAQTNNNPNAIILVTPTWGNQVYNPHAIGVWYNGTKWAIYNQDKTAMPVNATFNVLVFPNTDTSNPYSRIFSQTATTANSSGNTMYLSQETIYSQYILIFVTPAYNLGTTGQVPAGTYFNHNPGVWYNISPAQWGIFAEDQTTMSLGTHFMIAALNCTPSS